MDDLILVTDWEEVEKDSFYLTNEWKKNEGISEVKEARKLQKEGNLFYGYLVSAINYAIYTTMDANEVFINNNSDIIIYCETTIIGNKHEHRERYLN